MCAPRDLVPAVEIDAEEDRLGEEGKALEREGDADDWAGEAHEGRPEQSELEREHGTGDGADGEQHRGPLRPPPRELAIDVIAGLHPSPLGQHHQYGHGDPDLGEDDVEAEGERHLGAGGEEIGHRRLLELDPGRR